MSEKGKHRIKSVLIGLVSLAMIAGFVILFIAASKDRNDSTCQAVHLKVNGDPAPSFINQAAVMQLIRGNHQLDPVGKPLSAIRIRDLEKSVKTFPWVKDAELYLDNDNVLEINLTERVPVARVFTTGGSSFFLDSARVRLPVTGSFAVKLPVFTGFPDLSASGSRDDSLLLSGIARLSAYLEAHRFWMDQVDQVNINGDRQFELIPTVGNALIRFGHASDIDEKFDKLLVFYREGLNNVGWGSYDTLDLRYRGQIVATRAGHGGNPVIDSLLTEDGYQHGTGSADSAEMQRQPVEEKMAYESDASTNQKNSRAAVPKAVYRGTQP